MDYLRLFINHYILLDVVELIHGENIQYIQHRIFNEYEKKTNRITFLNHLFLVKIVHRPIQVQGKSRVDTWLQQDRIRQRQITRPV
jgi:hypothetical protein